MVFHKMQFKFYGISKWHGKLMGDATSTEDFFLWANSRGVDITGGKPFGDRPVPKAVEESYEWDPTYVSQEEADIFFDERDHG